MPPQSSAHFASSTENPAQVPVNYPVSRESEPQNCQTETAAAIPVQRPPGDGLGQQSWALKPRNSGVFREISGEPAATETRWRSERNCRQTLYAAFSMGYEPHNCGGCCLENPGPVAAVSTGARSGAGAVPAKRPSIRTSSRAATPTLRPTPETPRMAFEWRAKASERRAHLSLVCADTALALIAHPSGRMRPAAS